jgi:hypothetical protein
MVKAYVLTKLHKAGVTMSQTNVLNSTTLGVLMLGDQHLTYPQGAKQSHFVDVIDNETRLRSGVLPVREINEVMNPDGIVQFLALSRRERRGVLAIGADVQKTLKRFHLPTNIDGKLNPFITYNKDHIFCFGREGAYDVLTDEPFLLGVNLESSELNVLRKGDRTILGYSQGIIDLESQEHLFSIHPDQGSIGRVVEIEGDLACLVQTPDNLVMRTIFGRDVAEFPQNTDLSGIQLGDDIYFRFGPFLLDVLGKNAYLLGINEGGFFRSLHNRHILSPAPDGGLVALDRSQRDTRRDLLYTSLKEGDEEVKLI